MSASGQNIHPVYAVVGPDRFLRNEALQGVVRQLEGDMETLTRVDGSRAVLAEVLDDVRTMSLLGTRSVVVVDEADAFIRQHRAALERYCSEPSPSGCLILLCGSLPKNTRLYKIICSHGAVIQCEVPKGRAVAAWIAGRAQNVYGKRVRPAAANRLREHLGSAPGVLDAELAKLSAYVGQCGEIDAADIDALTGHNREEKVFAVTDAMSSGDTESALCNWEQVLATDRAAPGRAIAGLAWGVRRLLQARRDWEGGADVRELARRMYTDPAVLLRRLERVTCKELEEQRRDLLTADEAVKTGASTLNSAVETFIIKHSV